MNPRKLLFLCTGNYYRSRFAEELFNHHAEQKGLDWNADSKGLARDFAIYSNPGPMSVHTREALQQRNIPPAAAERMPVHVQAEDFESHDRIIALSREEHYPMMLTHFEEYADSIEYWIVEDLHLWDSAQAIAAIERSVRELVASLVR